MSDAVLANFDSLIVDAEQVFGDEADLADVFTGYDVNLGELRALVRAAEALREIVGIDALHRPTLGAMCTVAIDMGEIAEAALASLTDEGADGQD
jgi:hypothetical protein